MNAPRRTPPEHPDESAPTDDSPRSNADQPSPDNSSLVLLVTGSTMIAETRDRPLAYRLRERMLTWLASSGKADDDADDPHRIQPVVCSDLWYLNARELEDRPAIAIGEPLTNAATAVISSRLPTVFVIERSLRVHLDPEFIDLRAALWGANSQSTAAAIDVFAERYMREFLNAAS